MNPYAQDTKLYLKTKVGQNGKSIIEDVFFTPPLKLMSPFYEEENIANIMLISVSAGMMAGDYQEMDFAIGKDCKIKLTSQSFEKIHNTQEGFARRDTKIAVGENALFDFSPLPIIPFGNSDFRGMTTIHLAENAGLLYSEIIAAGRVSRDEIFKFKNFATTLKIYRENKLAFFDNTILDPQSLDLSNMCMFAIYTHYLNLLVMYPDIPIETLRELISAYDLNGGVSEIYGGGLCLKALGNGSEELIKLREDVGRLFFA
ncbi:urease accessory protein UreD [Helicobacter sp. 11S02596-1]|uniref:urease accessory protein UreD n=1 Tax=Helicobacter sp. 11S02596-1 TaxID=1476194 RepID=UPI000BA7A694|nr:urease accessory protein UreD [Helicobacter sp. 11S02596-1]PAF43170.1 urease accessory protein [Helicobacter sp. 11S02596-1]